MKSLMLKSLATATLLSSTLFGATNADISTFLKKGLSKNPSIQSISVDISERKHLKSLQGWDSLIVEFKAKVKQGKSIKDVKQKSIYFVHGDFITPELIDMKTGKKLNDEVAPKFDAAFYREANLIYGHANAKHKVAIFSDPLCPFCKKFVPSAFEYMKKYPDTFAVYYYHFPLERLHPASPTVVKAELVAKKMGIKDSELKMYNLYNHLNAREKDEQKILNAFNKAYGTKITKKDIAQKDILNEIKTDADIADKLMVNGTPTMFFDGVKDPAKNRYKEVKVK